MFSNVYVVIIFKKMKLSKVYRWHKCTAYIKFCFLFQAEHLKQEQEALMSQRWELEKLEDERKRMEESRRKTEFG